MADTKMPYTTPNPQGPPESPTPANPTHAPVNPPHAPAEPKPAPKK